MEILTVMVAYWWFWSVVVVGTVAWMGYESAQYRIPIDSKPYGINNGSAAWVLSGLLLWIATFPYYLVRRGKYIDRPVNPATPNTSAPSLSAELAALNELHKAGKLSDGDFERAKSKLLR